jgi:hypothetical protein
MNRDLALVKSAWTRIRTRLESEKERIYEEIRSYPRPIPACDQQFNFLLEERTRIARELQRLDEAFQPGLTGSDALARIEEFIGASSSLDDAARREIRSFLKQEFAGQSDAGSNIKDLV